MLNMNIPKQGGEQLETPNNKIDDAVKRFIKECEMRNNFDNKK